MSHVATIEARIVDLDALEAAAAAKGGVLVRGKRTFRSYEGNKACDHAVTVEGSGHEVGLTTRVDGQEGWNLAYDSWGPGAKLDQKFGPQLVGLKNEYLAQVAEAKLRRSGFMVRRAVDTAQQIQLVATQ